MNVWSVCLVAIIVLLSTLLPLTVSAQTQHSGLSMAPLRTEMTIEAGATRQGKFTVGNYTDSPMHIELTTKQFSVAGIDYHYTFKDIRQDIKSSWIRIETPSMDLQPKEEREIRYDVVIPVDTAPGGYYFSIQATTATKRGGQPVTLEAVTLLYLKAGGSLNYDSGIVGASVPTFTIDRRLPYEFDVRNAGNVHFTGYFYASAVEAKSAAEHTVLPDTQRRITGTVTLPLWPGLYDITYGYDADYGEKATATARVLFLPPWCIIVIIAFVVGGAWILQRQLKRKVV